MQIAAPVFTHLFMIITMKYQRWLVLSATLVLGQNSFVVKWNKIPLRSTSKLRLRHLGRENVRQR